MPARDAVVKGRSAMRPGPASRVWLVLAVSALYVLAFFPLRRATGEMAAALTVVPVAAAGWLLGLGPGLLAALVFVPLNACLFSVAGEDGWSIAIHRWPGVMSSFVVGAVTGALGTLVRRRNAHSDELALGNEQLHLQLEESRRIRESLREKEERLQIVFELAPDGYYLNDLAGTLIDGNKAAERIVGCRKEELIGKSFLKLDLLSPDQLARAAMLLGKNMMGLPTGPDEFRLKRRDGTHVPVEITTHPVKIKGRTVVLGIARDITERVRAEDVLRRERYFAKSLIETSPAFFLAIRGDGEILMTNPATLEALGYSEREFLGKDFVELTVPSEDRPFFRRTIRETVASKRPVAGENAFLARDGRQILVEWQANVATEESGELKCIFGFGLDVTERRQAEEDLRTYQNRLRALATELSRVEERERRRVAVQIHDCIGQNLAVLNIRLGALREVSAPSLRAQVDEVRQMIERVIRDTRALTFELGSPILYELGLEPALASLADFARERHGIAARFEGEGREESLPEDLRVLLFQAARELVTNVVKHARAKSLRLSFQLRDGCACLAVADDGVGFDPSAANSGGSGFGLFSLRERVSQHGGRVEIRSEPEQGTSVSVEVPSPCEPSGAH